MKSVKNMVRTCVRDLVPYKSARSNDGWVKHVLLDANESPFDNGVNRYPDPYQIKLKKEISKVSGIPISEIFLGNGSDEVLDILLRTFCEPRKDVVIITPPTYGMYKVLAGINDIAVEEIPLTKDFKLDVERIRFASDSTRIKIIFLNSPNNPTGNLFDEESIVTLTQSGTLVVVDEAYIDFSGRQSLKSQLVNYPNLVVVQTYSKSFGMAGVRLGTCLASEEIIGFMNKIKPPYNISGLTQEWVYKQLTSTDKFNKNIAEIVSQRERLAISLVKLPFVQKVYPSNSNFLLVRFRNSDLVYNYLLNAGIVVRDVSQKFLCENCLRITIGSPKDNDQLIKTLMEFKYEESTVY